MKKKHSLKYFFRGMGSAINLMPSSYQFFDRPDFQSDAEALAQDWKNIGADIQKSMGTFEKEIQKNEKVVSED